MARQQGLQAIGPGAGAGDDPNAARRIKARGGLGKAQRLRATDLQAEFLFAVMLTQEIAQAREQQRLGDRFAQDVIRPGA